uniref:Uncharacterized protein n=1 Tax=Picea sitchensis TaxID=3332 RepID=A9NT07_PICSI|nr:unknown [Picea sitchensis]
MERRLLVIMATFLLSLLFVATSQGSQYDECGNGEGGAHQCMRLQNAAVSTHRISYNVLRRDYAACKPQSGQSYYSNCDKNDNNNNNLMAAAAVNSYRRDCTRFNDCSRT